MKNKNLKRGFTMIELLIVITIVVITFAATFTIQSRFLVDTYIDTNTDQIVQTLRLAQMRSIARFNNSQWGVYFDEDIDGNDDKFVLFKGTSYADRDFSFDIETHLPDSLSFSNISLNGGGDDVVFNELTGATPNYGSIQILDNLGNPNTVSINSKGMVELN